MFHGKVSVIITVQFSALSTHQNEVCFRLSLHHLSPRSKILGICIYVAISVSAALVYISNTQLIQVCLPHNEARGTRLECPHILSHLEAGLHLQRDREPADLHKIVERCNL